MGVQSLEPLPNSGLAIRSIRLHLEQWVASFFPVWCLLVAPHTLRSSITSTTKFRVASATTKSNFCSSKNRRRQERRITLQLCQLNTIQLQQERLSSRLTQSIASEPELRRASRIDS